MTLYFKISLLSAGKPTVARKGIWEDITTYVNENGKRREVDNIYHSN